MKNVKWYMAAVVGLVAFFSSQGSWAMEEADACGGASETWCRIVEPPLDTGYGNQDDRYFLIARSPQEFESLHKQIVCPRGREGQVNCERYPGHPTLKHLRPKETFEGAISLAEAFRDWIVVVAVDHQRNSRGYRIEIHQPIWKTRTVTSGGQSTDVKEIHIPCEFLSPQAKEGEMYQQRQAQSQTQGARAVSRPFLMVAIRKADLREGGNQFTMTTPIYFDWKDEKLQESETIAKPITP